MQTSEKIKLKKLKSGDDVIVIAGKDKGRRGKIQKVLTNGRLIVEGVAIVTKHIRANPQRNIVGGRKEVESSIHHSNVMLVNPTTGKRDRVTFKQIEEKDGTFKKVRCFKSNSEFVDL
jgi:large subunit ribosomal protein L24